jgi:hypothetical protein
MRMTRRAGALCLRSLFDLNCPDQGLSLLDISRPFHLSALMKYLQPGGAHGSSFSFTGYFRLRSDLPGASFLSRLCPDVCGDKSGMDTGDESHTIP